ncbi:hypothetical protein AZE42_10188, partial [Rhizopogon vesiculosus]
MATRTYPSSKSPYHTHGVVCQSTVRVQETVRI